LATSNVETTSGCGDCQGRSRGNCISIGKSDIGKKAESCVKNSISKLLRNKRFLWVVKLSFSIGVLAFLIIKALQEGSLKELVEHDKNWTLLATAGFAMLITLVVQFLRWRILVRSLGLELSPGEALRLGFMGQLFSLLGIGMLGGDALKTFYLGRHNQGRMAEALTTVLVDRMIGLYGLVILAAIVCLMFDPTVLRVGNETERLMVIRLCWLAPIAAVASTIGLGVLLLPGVTTWAAWDMLAHTPKLGPLLERLVRAMRMYRQRLAPLALAIALTLLIHGCNCLTFYCLSMGLPAYSMSTGLPVPVEKPSFIEHSTAALLALAAGALPVGALEAVFNVIYRGVADPKMPGTQGFLIVLAYRLLQMCIALLGLYYYLAGRREVDQLMHDAEEAAAKDGLPEAGETGGSSNVHVAADC
jgi:glycosyltransferase 2 family protein